jgi:DNA-binding beta-propeller fold protein YncE
MRRRSIGVFLVLTGIVSCAVSLANSDSDEERRSKPYPEDIPAARTVVDPYPALNGIAVDPENDAVIASDPNRKSLLFYDRSRSTSDNSQTRPVRQIIGPATYIGMVASVVVDPQRQEIFTANNDIEDTVVVMPYAAKGNSAPRRVLSVPHQAWGLALSKSTNELAVTAEIFNAVVFYRREAKGVEAPVRVIRGSKTRLADPHGIYWDDTNAEIGVANHGNFRGVAHNVGAGCAPGPVAAKSEPVKSETAKSESSKSESPNPEAAEEGGEFRPPSIAIFSAKAKDDQAPLRIIEGDATKLDWPMGIAEDSVHNTIVVANNGDNSILIFDRQRGGNVAPIRIIGGERTGIDRPMGLAVDAKNGEIWISNYGNHTALAFDSTADGDVAPKRTLRSAPAGTPSPGFGNPMALAYDTERSQILVPN